MTPDGQLPTRGPMYGLPAEYKAPLGSWEELLSYLEAIASSDVSVRVSVGREQRYFEARGKLQPSEAAGKEIAHFTINTSSSRDEGGYIALAREKFRAGALATYDGDDYFHLEIEMEDVVLQIEDANSI